jgi:hypothetical protein
MQPFDDISTSWIPIAQLTAIYINAHLKEGHPKVNLSDLIPLLREESEALDPDEEPEEDEGENL